MINGLGLLATGRAEYLPLVKAQAAMVVAIKPEQDSLCTWAYGYRNLFLCEYFLANASRSQGEAPRNWRTWEKREPRDMERLLKKKD